MTSNNKRKINAFINRREIKAIKTSEEIMHNERPSNTHFVVLPDSISIHFSFCKPDGKFFFIMGKNPEKLVALPSQRNFICLSAKILLAASQISHPF